jgi:hypothetical protein
MDFFIAIAMLCQVTATNDENARYSYINDVARKQLSCQQSYIHCVNNKTNLVKHKALERCILEKK